MWVIIRHICGIYRIEVVYMSTSGKAQSKGCMAFSAVQQKWVYRRKMYTAFIQTRDKKRVSWWKAGCERTERNTKGQPSYCVRLYHGEEGTSFTDPKLRTSTARQAKCDSQYEQQHKTWRKAACLFQPFCLNLLNRPPWVMRKQVQILMVWNWYF